MELCPLCTTNPVSDKKSHIIPKMFRNKIGGLAHKFYRIEYNGKINIKPKQDIPKVQFLLCSDCESKLGVLDTYFANNIYKKLNDVNVGENVKIKKTYRETLKKYYYKVDLKLINLFYQSILFRLHISGLKDFADCKLPPHLYNAIREQLSKIIDLSQNSLKENSLLHKNNFLFLPYKNWTNQNVKQEDNFIMGFPFKNGYYVLVMNDLRVLLTEDISKIKYYKDSFIPDTSTDFRIEFLTDKLWNKNRENIVFNTDIHSIYRF